MVRSDGDHARQILALAEADLIALRNMLDRTSFSEGVFGFHAQQAIEKALKAWITVRGLTYPKSHDLSALIRILSSAGANIDAHPNLEDFTVFAVQYRYEAFDGLDTPLDRRQILVKLDALFADVRAAVRSQS